MGRSEALRSSAPYTDKSSDPDVLRCCTIQHFCLKNALPSPSAQISVPLSTAFGADTEGAQWIVGYLLEKVINNLSVWSSETELSNDTVDLLVTLVEKRER